MKIDIGGGTSPAAGHVNLDPVHGRREWQRNAQDIPWPADDSTVASARASHVLEHIPAGTERIAVFNEAWRVLQPGGTLEVIVPLLIHANGAPTWQAVADPTHVSFWCRESFDYFCGQIAQADYGIRWWEMVSFEAKDGWEGNVMLRKPR